MAEEKLKILFKLIVILVISSVNLFAQDSAPSIVPLPKEYKYLEGNFALENNPIVIQKYYSDDESISIALAELDSIFTELNGRKLFSQKGKSKLLLGIPSFNNEFKKYSGNTDKLGGEGYRLKIEASQIIISANSTRGIFYGLQSLKQLIKGAAREKILRSIDIVDFPTFKYRAVMDDISRGPIPTIDFVKYQIQRLAELKVNMFMQYIEHVVKTKSHPEFAPVDGSFTVEELKELSDYAKKYNVSMVGSFQSFGHFANILSTPEYKHLGENGTLISPLKKESYDFLKNIISEMIPAFDSPFFNVNCDETFDLGKAESKSLVDSIGYDGVYFQHIMKLYDIVKQFDKRMIIWGDIVLQYPLLLEKLPKDIIIATWTYDDHESYDEFIKPIKDAGFEIFVTPGVLNSSKIFPDYHQSLGNINEFANAGEKYGAVGLINTVWDDGGNAFFSNDWLGVAFGAEKSWNPQSSKSNFDARLNAGIYGSKDENFTKAIWKLNELSSLEPTDGMNDKILFAELLPDSGKQVKISLIDREKVLKITNDVDSILHETFLPNYPQDKIYIQFVSDLYKGLARERFVLLDASMLYSNADSVYESDPSESRKLITKTISRIDEIINNFRELKNRFEILWLAENHTYALDRINNKYAKKINDYEDVKALLINSLKKFDSGETISSKKEVRLAISKLPGKYFREWLMINPLPNVDVSSNSQIDYLAGMGGELNAVPKVTQEFYYDSLKYRWRRVVTDYSDVVSLSELFPGQSKNVVMYSFANIDCEHDTTVNALIGSDEGIQIIINGNKIFQAAGNGKLIPDEFSFSLPLKKGRNNLMLKISQTEGDWGFTFRLPNSQVRNSKNRYKIISNKAETK